MAASAARVTFVTFFPSATAADTVRYRRWFRREMVFRLVVSFDLCHVAEAEGDGLPGLIRGLQGVIFEVVPAQAAARGALHHHVGGGAAEVRGVAVVDLWRSAASCM